MHCALCAVYCEQCTLYFVILFHSDFMLCTLCTVYFVLITFVSFRFYALCMSSFGERAVCESVAIPGEFFICSDQVNSSFAQTHIY